MSMFRDFDGGVKLPSMGTNTPSSVRLLGLFNSNTRISFLGSLSEEIKQLELRVKQGKRDQWSAMRLLERRRQQKQGMCYHAWLYVSDDDGSEIKC
eukprot:3231127-Rhodomonas_salina.1